MLPAADIVQGKQEDSMTYNEIVAQIAERLELPKGFVDKVYRGYWRAVREHIVSLPLKTDLTDEEFMGLQPNVNIPSLGKFYVTLDRFKAIKERIKIAIEQKNKDNATHQEDTADIQPCAGDGRHL